MYAAFLVLGDFASNILGRIVSVSDVGVPGNFYLQILHGSYPPIIHTAAALRYAFTDVEHAQRSPVFCPG